MTDESDFPYFRNGLPGVGDERREAALARSIISEDIESAEGYIASAGLAHAVNVALLLGKPLLLTGRPGTGKTILAKVIAHNLTQDGDALPLRKFETKSTSVARDLFYTYDAIAAFRDQDAEKRATSFITYQALGRAILEAFPSDRVSDFHPEPASRQKLSGPRRSVVLIDEIDKAPRDFPNDLLNEIDRLYFRVPELGLGTPGADEEKRQIEPALRPIIVITSNDEKSLPEPFLRRCVYFHLEEPKGTELRKIVDKRLSGLWQGNRNLVTEAQDIFEKLKETVKDQSSMSTAEFLDWLQVLGKLVDPTKPLEQQPDVVHDSLPALVKSELALKEAQRQHPKTTER